jgi:hypothetical protein
MAVSVGMKTVPTNEGSVNSVARLVPSRLAARVDSSGRDFTALVTDV